MLPLYANFNSANRGSKSWVILSFTLSSNHGPIVPEGPWTLTQIGSKADCNHCVAHPTGDSPLQPTSKSNLRFRGPLLSRELQYWPTKPPFPHRPPSRLQRVSYASRQCHTKVPWKHPCEIAFKSGLRGWPLSHNVNCWRPTSHYYCIILCQKSFIMPMLPNSGKVEQQENLQRAGKLILLHWKCRLYVESEFPR